MSEAARVGDPIEHSSALGGLLAGLAIGSGAVLIGIAVVGTAGLGAAAVVAMLGAGAATGAGIGQLLGSLSFAQRETGRIRSGSANVFINGKPAARAHVDYAECSDHAGVSKTVAQGSRSVHINGVPAARLGDRTVCDARISAGSSNVFIGGETETTDEISPEVPGWLEGAVLGVGLASAIALVGPAMALWGLFGGVVGGGAGYRLGGERYGEGSDEQKLMAFGGALIVGGLAARYKLQPNGGLGANLGNTRVTQRSKNPATPSLRPVRGSDGRFIKSGEHIKHNRKTEYPSDYRAGVRERVLDANTIKKGRNAGKVMTKEGERVSRHDPRLTIEHNKPVVEHWNERGYNSSRVERNDFFNDVSNMSLRLRSVNSADGARLRLQGKLYRQDLGPNYN
ncbi:PAAR domain-containing protein [Pseudomonas plecoglossicida]|uniref:PAAR domain-containing protein n=1 Tax=Pseudomonas plecoglossicida TaxID=70775 RepID=UPI003D1C1A7C